jgi:hypothetical protein
MVMKADEVWSAEETSCLATALGETGCARNLPHNQKTVAVAKSSSEKGKC